MASVELKEFTDEELRDELFKRQIARQDNKPTQWCDECANFNAWTDINKDAPESYNPCGKRHKMHFVMPESPSDLEYGFYRRGCKDRVDAAPSAWRREQA